MQEGASIGKSVAEVDLVLAAELLQTLAARPFDYHLGNHIVENYLLEFLWLVHEIFIQHATAAHHIVLLLHRLPILTFRQLSSHIVGYEYFYFLIGQIFGSQIAQFSNRSLTGHVSPRN